jgi:uncharacterized phage protein gp47/JayE
MPRSVNGFSLPTLSETVNSIRGDLQAQFPGEDPYIRGAVWWVVAAVWGSAVYTVITMLAWLARELFASTATETYLARHAAEYGVERNPATACAVTVEFTWTATGHDIPAGTVLVADDGTEYTTDALISDPGGSYPDNASGAATASTKGLAASVAVGGTLTLQTPIAGITSAGEVTDSTPGADQEGVEEWRDRILAAKRTIPHGGTLADFEAWCLEVDGVEQAWVSKAAAGSVLAVIDPSAYDSAVQAYVDSVRPVSGEFTAVGSNDDAVNMTIDGTLDGTVAKATVRANIVAAVEELYAREGVPGGTIYNSDVRQAIGSAAGLDHYSLTSYNGDGTGASDYTSTSPDIPVIGTVTWAGGLA